MAYLKDTKSGFEQSSKAQVFHDRANASRGELTKFIVSISTASIGFIYLDAGFNTLNNELQRVLIWATLLAFFAAASISVLAWHFDARRFYFRAKSIEATEEEVTEELYSRSVALSRSSRRLTWSARVLFVLGITGLLSLAILRV